MTRPLLRVVDYIANPGGGVRFGVQTLLAFLERKEWQIEVVSQGEALERYRAALRGLDHVAFRELPATRTWRDRTYLRGIPGAGPLNWLLRTPRFHFEVPREVFDGCDLVWLPWLHRHRIPWDLSPKAVASLHDVITIDFPGIVPAFQRRDEAETVSGWLRSRARVVVSSNATAERLRELFGTDPARLSVVPLSGDHVRRERAPAPSAWPFLNHPYAFAPVNVTLHKNHEVLLEAFGAWRAKVPLVLTGSGTRLWGDASPRTYALRRLAEASGLVEDRSIFALGYVDDASYDALLGGAWALVMPTLAEGGGSFPVWEALLAGVPVVCSDIPVMREMMDRVGGQILWFDPRSERSLVERLDELSSDYDRFKRAAVAQVPGLHRRTWADVGQDYAGIMMP